MDSQLERYFKMLRQFSHMLLNKTLESEGKTKFDLKLSQLKALAAFKEDRPFTMKELAANSMIKLPNMTTLVDSLIEEGLAEREKDTRDRRRVLVRLTPAGMSLRKKFLQNRRKLAMSFFSNLNEQKKTDLLTFLEKACAILQEAIDNKKQ